jgi:thioesterase domain-containing protein
MHIIRLFWTAASIELPVNIFFETPTIRRMAAAIHDGSGLLARDLIRLRDGVEDIPLFLFAGSGGVMLELMGLVNALDYPGVIYGIPPSGLDGIAPIDTCFEAEATRMLSIIRRVQRTGPYRLVGYSTGGITALEIARQIREEDSDAVVLSLLDSSLSDHSWPLGVWLRFMLRKLTTNLRRIKLRRPIPRQAAAGKLDINPPRRGTQYEFRFRNPHKPDYPYYSPFWVSHHPPNYTRVFGNVGRMRGLYMPRCYDGRVFFFVSAGGDPLVCDLEKVWPKYLPNAEWIHLPGNHLTMMLGRNAARLAQEITKRLSQRFGLTES